MKKVRPPSKPISLAVAHATRLMHRHANSIRPKKIQNTRVRRPWRTSLTTIGFSRSDHEATVLMSAPPWRGAREERSLDLPLRHRHERVLEVELARLEAAHRQVGAHQHPEQARRGLLRPPRGRHRPRGELDGDPHRRSL